MGRIEQSPIRGCQESSHDERNSVIRDEQMRDVLDEFGWKVGERRVGVGGFPFFGQDSGKK